MVVAAGVRCVGQVEDGVVSHVKPPKSLSEELVKEFGLEAYAMPERGAEAELSSLLFQNGRRMKVDPPSEADRKRVLQQVVAAYPRVTFAHNLEPDDVYLRWLSVYLSANKDSSPGAVWCNLGATVEEAWNNHGRFLADVCQKRLRLLATMPEAQFAKLLLDPVASVEAGLRDPVRLFVKNEPHTVAKIEAKRFRLIASVSLVDSLIQRFIFSEQNKAEVRNWETIPSCAGMGLEDDHAVKFWRKLSKSACYTSTDVSGWDWSMAKWMLLMEADARDKLTHGPRWWHVVQRRLLTLMAHKCYQLSGKRAKLYTLDEPGVMDSGSQVTAASNSRIRVMMHLLASGFPLRFAGGFSCISMGDDAVERTFEDMAGKYSKLGLRLTDVKPVRGSMEFCSHEITANACKSLNVDKSIYKFLIGDRTRERYESLCVSALRHYPEVREKLSKYVQ